MAEMFRFTTYPLCQFFKPRSMQDVGENSYTLLSNGEGKIGSSWSGTSLIHHRYGGRLSNEHMNFFTVRMGCVTYNPSLPSFTYGANTCFAGATFDKKGGIYVFHSYGLDVPTPLLQLVDQDKVFGGVVGGWHDSIECHRTLFNDLGMKVARPSADLKVSFEVYGLPGDNAVVYQYIQ